MELKPLIERAEKAAGSQKAFGLMVGQAPSTLRAAKAGLQGLPDHVCVRLAELIGEAPMTVIAASKLVTEKKEEVRKVWRPFVSRAAAVILGTVILNMTPTPSEAAPVAKSLIEQCILCKIAKQWIKTMTARLANFYGALPRTAALPSGCAG